MSKEKLKPCPFCGGEATVRNPRQCDAFIKRPIVFWVRCENGCVEQFQTHETPLAAIKAWNRRTKNE